MHRWSRDQRLLSRAAQQNARSGCAQSRSAESGTPTLSDRCPCCLSLRSDLRRGLVAIVHIPRYHRRIADQYGSRNERSTGAGSTRAGHRQIGQSPDPSRSPSGRPRHPPARSGSRCQQQRAQATLPEQLSHVPGDHRQDLALRSSRPTGGNGRSAGSDPRMSPRRVPSAWARKRNHIPWRSRAVRQQGRLWMVRSRRRRTWDDALEDGQRLLHPIGHGTAKLLGLIAKACEAGCRQKLTCGHTNPLSIGPVSAEQAERRLNDVVTAR
mgnify:CR=1 FL=1